MRLSFRNIVLLIGQLLMIGQLLVLATGPNLPGSSMQHPESAGLFWPQPLHRVAKAAADVLLLDKLVDLAGALPSLAVSAAARRARKPRG